MGRIKHLASLTNLITDAVHRIDSRISAYSLAARGEYGPAVQKGVQQRLPAKYPLSAAQKDVLDHSALIESTPLSAGIAPVLQDPQILSRHVKAVAVCLKADVVGRCMVPKSAYYSRDSHGRRIACRYGHAVVIVMRKEWNPVNASVGSNWMGDKGKYNGYET
jgi:hypothetical protein